MKSSTYLSFAFLLLSSTFMLGCGENTTTTTNSPTPTSDNKSTVKPIAIDPAASNINTNDMMEHIKKLASDEFEGRGPNSKGEELTIKYLTEVSQKLGLKPGNPDGTFVQKVPLVSYEIDPNTEMKFSAGDKTVNLKFRDEFVAWTRQLVDKVDMNGDLVFVGYGAEAPEYQWDDFKGEDLKGKILVMLINDPPLPDDKMFGGKAMTYYGRWTYKFEQAAKKGAAGCIIIHETVPAGYPWEVVKNSWGSGGFTFSDNNNNLSLCPVESWTTFDKAKEIFQLAGKDLEELKKEALKKEFKPVNLGVKASLSLKNKYKKIESNNFIAKLEGSDPELKNEYVVFTAHWDHFGIGLPATDDKGKPVNDDKIYNGAKDNATGTAGLLELAKTYTKLSTPPKRSLLFLAVTAEERGLLGSAYYAQNPLYPLAKTTAVINMDSMNVWGKTKDIIVVGLGNSTLDDYVQGVAATQNRTVKPDQEPEKGYFYRSDHFSFAKQGVPALNAGEGEEYIGKPAGEGKKLSDEYTAKDYHKPSDDIKPNWDLSGAVEDLQMLFQIGYEVANAKQIPAWRDGTEFKAKREESLKAGK
ncbi:MAG: M28 family metallopeptidase [Blastocatellia bacterium]